jgi:hypothetical protein
MKQKKGGVITLPLSDSRASIKSFSPTNRFWRMSAILAKLLEIIEITEVGVIARNTI